MKLVFVPGRGFEKYHGSITLPVEKVKVGAESGWAFEYISQPDRVIPLDEFTCNLSVGYVLSAAANSQWEWVEFYIVTLMVKFQPTLLEVYSWMYDLFCEVRECAEDPEYILAGK